MTSNKKVKKKVNKKETLISYKNKEMIVDTVISNKQSYFTIYNRKSKEISQESEIEINWKSYIPINTNSSFITSESILFPSEAKKYWSKEELILIIQRYIKKYVDIPEDYLIICSYYVLLTYVYSGFSEIPYLRVIWDYWSWKSRFLKTIWSICYNPIITNWWTSLSAIFRMIEKFKWTLILDEADFSLSDTYSEMIKLLNNGYQKGNPIMRADWEWFEPNCYEVYCPKIIGGRMEFKDKATESRCLSNIMKKSKKTNIPIWLDDKFSEESLELRNMLLKFRFDYLDKVELKNKNIEWIEPRLNQIINPILSLVDNREMEEIIIKNLKSKQEDIKEERNNSLLWIILSIIKRRLYNKEEAYYRDILDDLEVIEWKHYFNPRKLWSLLRQNSLKGFRKNDWTVIKKEENKEELERLYNEYSIK